jgi:hypothetical protein
MAAAEVDPQQAILTKITDAIREYYRPPRQNQEVRDCAFLICPEDDFYHKHIQFIAPRLAAAILRIFPAVFEEIYLQNADNPRAWFRTTADIILHILQEINVDGSERFSRAHNNVPVRPHNPDPTSVYANRGSWNFYCLTKSILLASTWSQTMRNNIRRLARSIFPFDNLHYKRMNYVAGRLAAQFLEENPDLFQFAPITAGRDQREIQEFNNAVVVRGHIRNSLRHLRENPGRLF